MCSKCKKILMGFTDKLFPQGTHMCLIYRDEAERRKIISKFLEFGFSSDEKVGYFADMMTSSEVIAFLKEMGVEIPKQGSPEKFTVASAESTYCPKGKFVPEDMLNNLRNYYDQAIAEGYGGARVSGEMSWSLKGIPGSDRLVEYESLINNVVKTHPITAVCQYDANRFDGATIFDILRVHPFMIAHGQIVSNPAYIKPEEFLREFYGRG